MTFFIYILSMKDDELTKIISDLQEKFTQIPQSAYKDLALFLNLPEKEITISPFTIRASALAANRGITTMHYELRKQILTKVCIFDIPLQISSY